MEDRKSVIQENFPKLKDKIAKLKGPSKYLNTKVLITIVENRAILRPSIIKPQNIRNKKIH